MILNMKKSVFAALAVLAAVSCGKKEGYLTVSGECPADSVFLFTISANGVEFAQATDNGQFLIKGNVDAPEYALLADSRILPESSMQVEMFLEPGDIVVTPSSDGGFDVTGTPANDAFVSYRKSTAELETIYSEAYMSGNRAVIDSVLEVHRSISVDFVRENMDNYAGLHVLQGVSDEFTDEQILELLGLCPDNLKECGLWKQLSDDANNGISLKKNGYIDFSQSGIDGKSEISLKSVVEKPGNKYVLLDFWASWCGPCMGEMPYLKAVYAKYHSKGLEIFGCSLDRNEEDWKAAVEDGKLGWIHVSDLKAWNNSAAKLYGVRSIPANYLIDCATGAIIATDLRGEALEAKLSQLLK